MKTLQIKDGSGKMFDQIAARYDLLNQIISLGVHTTWRNYAIRALQLTPHSRVLDIATGTADFALQIVKLFPAHVIGLDPSKGMLSIARNKIIRKNKQTSIDLVDGDAQALPFPDASFDAITMAFGIRNVPDRGKALQEISRVLKPKGRVVLLELSDPPPGVFQNLAKFYIRHIVPWVGSILSSSSQYDYLQRSIVRFPAPQEFSAMLSENHLDVLQVKPLTFGTCHLYLATPSARSSLQRPNPLDSTKL